ncbi:MAG: cadherin-like domain-containing protein [Deltaproteobacteria bacterium]|nr:cadherin-like domain-containing protein [Deltaproteobacteria bacterium]
MTTPFIDRFESSLLIAASVLLAGCGSAADGAYDDLVLEPDDGASVVDADAPDELTADVEPADILPGFDLWAESVAGTEDVLLSWDDQGAAQYEVWSSDAPYFGPGDAGSSLVTTTAQTTAVDAGITCLGCPNRYYAIVAQGAATTTSTTVGVHTLDVYGGFNVVPLSLVNPDLPNASSLVSIAGPAFVTALYWWYPGQTWLSWWIGSPFGEWDNRLGDTPLINLSIAASETRVLTGYVPSPGEMSLPLVAGQNFVTLPLTHPDMTASEVIASSPAGLVTAIGGWNAATQSPRWYPADGVDFTVESGSNLVLLTTGTGQWPFSQCGNGAVDPGESCDDGNQIDGDGCEASCQYTAPVASDDAYVAEHNGTLSIAAAGLLSNDTAWDGGALTVASADPQSEAGGQVTVAADGSFDYQPPADFFGEDRFSYVAEDGVGATASASVELVVRPVNISVLALQDGMGGFTVAGASQFDGLGDRVAGGGDINGDGLDDIVIGAAPATFGFVGSAGRAYVVFGKTDTNPVLAEWLHASLGLGFAIEPRTGSGNMGSAVSIVEDLDGDGLDEVLLTAPNLYLTGEAYLVRGRAQTTAFPLPQLDFGAGGYTINTDNFTSVGSSGFFGRNAASLGDVDGDGLSDMVFSDSRTHIGEIQSNTGQTYVVFGQPTGPLLTSDVAAGQGGFVITNESASINHTVRGANAAGDVNGDGLQDIVLGAPDADFAGNDAGRCYVVFGKSDGDPVDLAALGSNGFVIDGQSPDDHSGYWVDGAGDVNGDGLEDVVIGAWAASPNGLASGSTYVVFGKADGAPVNLDDIAAGIGGFAVLGEAFLDYSSQEGAGSVGDVNGDGLVDLGIGARLADGPAGTWSGRAYIVYGRGQDTTPVELSDIAAGIGGFTLDGEANDQVGTGIDGAGDVNGDGYDDIVVGAQASQPNGFSSGRVYVIHGSPSSH